MNEISEKYKNWLVSLESDNFSLFIKTWFAFLSSIQQLHSGMTEESKDGDKKFINAYAKGYLKKVSLDPVLQANIARVYDLSKLTIKTNYIENYFPTFYRLNKDYRLEVIDDINDLSLSFKVTGDDKERKLDIHLRSNKQKFQDAFGHYINTVINLSECIKDGSFENWDNFYKLISTSIRKEGLRLIELGTKTKTKAFEKKTVVLDSSISLIIPHIRIQFKPQELFIPLPNADYPNDTSYEQEVKEWFVDFSYKLRNILFHSILDPFDSQWSEIVKHCYQGLREILIQNIRFIEELNGRLPETTTNSYSSEEGFILGKRTIENIVMQEKKALEEVAFSEDDDKNRT